MKSGADSSPALAGALIGLIGAARAVAADAVSYLVTAWCTLRIRGPETAPSPRTARPSPRSEIRADRGVLLGRRSVVGHFVS
ncbi:hypothetical protein [Streptomyces mirabilis]|uniref:hypothetical protein n=1 Tax=Streptomyces mirabilis TaxID=68239 RepID=UPI0036DED5D1